MQKILSFVLIGLIIVYQWQLRYGPGGILDIQKVKQEVKKQTSFNNELQERNRETYMQIKGLKGSTEVLEARARMELNLVKKDEILVLLPANK